MASPPETHVVARAPARRSLLFRVAMLLAAIGLGIAAYWTWQRYREAEDRFLWLDNRIAAMDRTTRSEARRLCAANRERILSWSDFRVDEDRCVLMKDPAGRTRLYGAALDASDQPRIYWIIFKRNADDADWEMAGCGVEL